MKRLLTAALATLALTAYVAAPIKAEASQVYFDYNDHVWVGFGSPSEPVQPGDAYGAIGSRFSTGTVYATSNRDVDNFTLGNQYQACSGRIFWFYSPKVTTVKFFYEGHVAGLPKCQKIGKVEQFDFH